MSGDTHDITSMVVEAEGILTYAESGLSVPVRRGHR
jgi:hypothetical protein